MPTVTLRPNETFDSTGWTLTGGSAHGVLSDDSDATHAAVSGASINLLTIGFGTSTIPTTAKIRNVTLRLRGKSSALDKQLGTLLGTPVGQFPNQPFFPPTSTTELTGTARTTMPNGAQWTQAGIDGLTLYAYGQSGGGYTITLYEAYLDVLYAGAPSATALAPSGTVDDPTPDGSYQYAMGSDGGQLSRRRIKVFSAAQYGAGGFDPETSTATWDEGETFTSSNSFTVGSPLPEGTYRAYVKLAADINGAAHWSEWSYVGFVVDIDEPGVPTIVTVTGDDDLGRIAIDLDATSGDAGTDYFEVERSFDDGLTSEQIRSGGEITYSGAVVHIWDYELASDQQVRYRARAWSTDSGIAVPSEWSSWTAAVSYTSLRWWFKCPNNPAINASFQLSAPPQWKAPIDEGVFVPLDDGTTRTAIKPVVVTGARQAAIGRLFLRTLSAADRSALDALLTDGRVLLVQAPTGRPFGSRYISAGEASFDPFSPNARSLTMDVSVPFVEVASPDGGLDSWE